MSELEAVVCSPSTYTRYEDIYIYYVYIRRVESIGKAPIRSVVTRFSLKTLEPKHHEHGVTLPGTCALFSKPTTAEQTMPRDPTYPLLPSLCQRNACRALAICGIDEDMPAKDRGSPIPEQQPHPSEDGQPYRFSISLPPTAHQQSSIAARRLRLESDPGRHLGATCGSSLWSATEVMVRELFAQDSILRAACRGKRVVELGAGMGALGMSLALCSGAREVILTDVRAQLPLIAHNCRLNGFHLGYAQSRARAGMGAELGGRNAAAAVAQLGDAGHKIEKGLGVGHGAAAHAATVSVAELEWGRWPDPQNGAGVERNHMDPQSEYEGAGASAARDDERTFGTCRCANVDVVVGADVAYDRRSFAPLLAVLNALVACAGTEQIFLCLPHRFEAQRCESPEPLLDSNGCALAAQSTFDGQSDKQLKSLGVTRERDADIDNAVAEGAASESATAAESLTMPKTLSSSSVRPAFDGVNSSTETGFVSLQTEFVDMATEHGYTVTIVHTATKQETGAASDMNLLKLTPLPSCKGF